MTNATLTDGGVSDAPVPGLANLRSAGRWACDGGAIRSHQLFRADSPDALDARGTRALRDLGVTLLVDLRSHAEVAERDYRFDGIARSGHPIALLEPGQLHDPGLTLESLYVRLLAHHGATLADAVRTIAHHPGPVLVHCTAGKDRTGVTIALVLLALGVDRETVVADYASTHRNLVGPWTNGYLARFPDGVELPTNLLEILNGSPAALIEQIIDQVEAEHGGARNYLRDHGLTDTDFDALRTRLVEPTA